jgi:type I restriction enzyme S subunit
MSNQSAKLGDVCDFLYGEGLTEAQRRGGEFPVYGSNGIVGWHDRPLTQEPTIVIGRKGSIGEVHLSELPCWPIDTTYYVQLKEKPCDLVWLYYTLLVLDLTKLNKSAAVPGLNRNDAYEKGIPLPPLDEQKRIAAILSKADRLRRLRRYARELSDGYLGSVFLGMFGDPVSNPMGWKVKCLGDVVENHDARRIPLKESERAKRQGAYPYYGATGIIDYIDDFIFDETTLLIAEDGKNLLKRSKPIAFVAYGKYWVNNHAHVVAGIGLVDLDYLGGSLNNRDISSFVTGIDQWKLTRANLDRILVQVPPLPLQQKYAEAVQKFERLRA